MNEPEFPTVFRGYDPVQVDQHVTALEQIAEAARQEAAQSAVELSKLRHLHEALSEELEDQRRAITELEAQTRTVSSPTFADLGERIGAMLGLADEEAAAMREGANADVEEIRRGAQEAAALTRAEADRYAEEMRSKAEVESAETLSRAKKEADAIIDDAAREAAARREEAEAYFEQQRATAAASAADFERTLGERRERSVAEFTAQMAKQDQALAAVQERADLLARESEEDHRTKADEAARVLEAARREASTLVSSAKEQADRIRRDSERELAAATARRDSITAQLSNVRNMLATLGGGPTSFGSPATDEPRDAGVAATVDAPVPASGAGAQDEGAGHTRESSTDELGTGEHDDTTAVEAHGGIQQPEGDEAQGDARQGDHADARQAEADQVEADEVEAHDQKDHDGDETEHAEQHADADDHATARH
jgi:hypothetical protein